MLAYKQGNVTVVSFSVYLALSLFATSYLAGITSVAGAMVAGALALDGLVVTLLGDHIDLGAWYGVIAGIGMIYTVVTNPDGIVGPFHERLNARWLRGRPDRGGDRRPRRPRRADPARGPSRATSCSPSGTSPCATAG